MNNLLSYCGLVDAKIRASDKHLPVRLLKITVYKGYPYISSYLPDCSTELVCKYAVVKNISILRLNFCGKIFDKIEWYTSKTVGNEGNLTTVAMLCTSRANGRSENSREGDGTASSNVVDIIFPLV